MIRPMEIPTTLLSVPALRGRLDQRSPKITPKQLNHVAVAVLISVYQL